MFISGFSLVEYSMIIHFLDYLEKRIFPQLVVIVSDLARRKKELEYVLAN